MKDRVQLFGQLAMVTAVVVAFLFAAPIGVAIFGIIFELLLEALSQQPFHVGGIFLSVCVVLVLSFLGAGSRMASHTVIYFVSRAFLLLLSPLIGIVSLSVIYLGLGNWKGFGHVANYVFLIIGIAFGALAAAAIKYAVGWRGSYSIAFFSTLTVITLPAVLFILW
jgi:hypothetical protein